jgi:hypothetical protein
MGAMRGEHTGEMGREGGMAEDEEEKAGSREYADNNSWNTFRGLEDTPSLLIVGSGNGINKGLGCAIEAVVE